MPHRFEGVVAVVAALLVVVAAVLVVTVEVEVQVAVDLYYKNC